MKKTKLILRIISAVAFAGAIPCIVVAAINFGNFGNSLHLLMIPGIFLVAVSIILLVISCIAENFKRVREMQKQALISWNKFNQGNDIVCPSCGEKNDSDAEFCDKCGANLKKACPECGTTNDVDAEFCKKCGNKIK